MSTPTVTTTEARAAHSCPRWCTVEPQEHEAELEPWEGYRYHRVELWTSRGGRVGVVINAVTTPSGEFDAEQPPAFDLGDGCMMSAADARAMASALLRAAAEIEALGASA